MFGISAILPVYGAFDSSDETRPLEVGDSVMIKDVNIIVKISSISESSSGTQYIVSGLPDVYPPWPDTYLADKLERVGALEQFQGIHDLVTFFQQLGAMLIGSD